MPEKSIPHVVVLSSLFPSKVQPNAGPFIRERMFRVGQRLPITVVAPTPWFPFQKLIRLLKPSFRPGAPSAEKQGNVEVRYPRFLCFPGILKRWDGFFMALAAWRHLRQLKKQGKMDILDAHFGYPDGYAAVLLGRWFKLPVTITLRGTEVRHAQDKTLAPLLTQALLGASRVFTVSESLRQVAIQLGISPDKVRVVGNGVDLKKFYKIDKKAARHELGIAEDAVVLISVGGLVERKGFHRVIECLPALRTIYPKLCYLIVGGPSQEGDWTENLKQQVQNLGLQECVRFLGIMPSEKLSVPLSASDLFALSTRNEGWANVFLEAMACGLPVVTTNVGGNQEVVSRPDLGTVVPFGEHDLLLNALQAALERPWDAQSIQDYAQANTWDKRVDVLVQEFNALLAQGAVK